MNARDCEDECVAWEGRRWLVLFLFLSVTGESSFFFTSLAISTKSANKEEKQ